MTYLFTFCCFFSIFFGIILAQTANNWNQLYWTQIYVSLNIFSCKFMYVCDCIFNGGIGVCKWFSCIFFKAVVNSGSKQIHEKKNPIKFNRKQLCFWVFEMPPFKYMLWSKFWHIAATDQIGIFGTNWFLYSESGAEVSS